MHQRRKNHFTDFESGPDKAADRDGQEEKAAAKRTRLFFRLSPSDYLGLHQRYAEIIGNDTSLSSLCLSKKEEEIEAIAKKWASVISNKYAREDAEEAARIVLRSGIVTELPELREADLGGRKRFFGLTRADFHLSLIHI